MTLDVLKSLELPLTREQIVAALVGALLAAAALGTYRKRKREHKINTPVDPEEIRRKRLATLQSSQHQATPVAPVAAATVAAAGASNKIENSTRGLTGPSRKKTAGSRRIVVPTESVSWAGKTASRIDLRRRREAFIAAAALAAQDANKEGQEDDNTTNAGLAEKSSSSSAEPSAAPTTSGPAASVSAPTSEPGASSWSDTAQPPASAPAASSSRETSAQQEQQERQRMTPVLPESTPLAASAPTAPPSDLPGSMQHGDLFELLQSGARPAYEALIDIVSEVANDSVIGGRGRRKDRHAGPHTPVGICRRWWDAAWGAGKAEEASVAVDVLGLHLGATQDDLFTSAEEQRATILLALLATSPSPIMVRHIFAANPSAARAALRLAVAPVKKELSRESAAGGQLRTGRGAAAPAAAAAASAITTRRLESWQPLEGLESLEGLFRSAAGAAALGVVLGLEARQDYAHGAAFEAESVLGPLLGGLPCVLSLNEHLRVAQETAGATPFSSTPTLGNQLAQRSAEEAWRKVPVAHRLAKLLPELRRAGPRARNALVHQYNASFEAKTRNRQSFVALVEAALVKAMTTKGIMRESKPDVCSWLSKAIFLHEGLPEMCNDHGAPERLGAEGSTCASSAFLMSLSALLLRMGAGKFSSLGAKNMDSVDIAYVESGSVQWEGGETAAADEDSGEESGDEHASDNSDNGEGDAHATADLPPRGRGVEEEKGGEPQEHRRGEPTSAGGNDNGGESGKDEEQDQARAENEQPRPHGFNFATELFFLTHRALQVIVAPLTKRREETQRVLGDSALAHTGLTLGGDDDDEGQDSAAAPAAGGGVARLQLRVFKEASSAMSLGWALEGFGSDAVTGHACQLAIFTASWLGLYIGGDQTGGAGADGFGMVSPAPSALSGTFSKIAPTLIETMCSSWVRAALNGRDDQFLTRQVAEDAAQFCGQIMERVDLRLSPVTQSMLVEVLETLVLTGTRALENDKKGRSKRNANRANARSGGFKGSMYWGSRRGYAGAILDSEELRRTLPRQLMRLYTSVQQVDGLAAEHFFGYFKYGVRMRIGKIILHLWSHPLQEPRQAILDLIRASQPTTGATAAASSPPSPPAQAIGGGGGDGENATVGDVPPPLPSNPLATEFFKTAFDVFTYFINDAIGRLRDGVIEERSNGGDVLETGHAHWTKYMRERKQCVSALKSMVHSILTLLTTLGEEKEVMDALRIGTLGARSAALVSIMFRSLYGEESAELAVADPKAWGWDKADLGRMTCELLVGLTAHGANDATRTFAAALHDSDPEFDTGLLKSVAAGQGGECLRGNVLESLSRALEDGDIERRIAEEEQAAAAAVAGGAHGGVADPFEGVTETSEGVGVDEFVRHYGDTMTDLVYTQVESLSPGHYFDSRREGSTLRQPRKVATEVTRKLPRIMPNPPHPDSAVFAVVEEDALNFSRFVISGPVDTPYENGLFVFDVFLPANYPTDPPLVQMITTGQGTVKFNANLYSDGKVCLSVLGKDSGSGTAGSGDYWNPDTSSLWQVFVSVQTMILLKDPYYNEGGGRSNMRGRRTAETEEASAHENARVTLETIRHAAVANLRHPPTGCEELIRCHFRALRDRILLRCKKAVEEAPDERLKRATMRASAELRAEMDKLS